MEGPPQERMTKRCYVWGVLFFLTVGVCLGSFGWFVYRIHAWNQFHMTPVPVVQRNPNLAELQVERTVAVGRQARCVIFMCELALGPDLTSCYEKYPPLQSTVEVMTDGNECRSLGDTDAYRSGNIALFILGVVLAALLPFWISCNFAYACNRSRHANGCEYCC
jgi:hypothetical protein